MDKKGISAKASTIPHCELLMTSVVLLLIHGEDDIIHHNMILFYKTDNCQRQYQHLS
jgi:hypothetical protein